MYGTAIGVDTEEITARISGKWNKGSRVSSLTRDSRINASNARRARILRSDRKEVVDPYRLPIILHWKPVENWHAPIELEVVSLHRFR